jgi:hypothetical protein
MQVFEDAYYLSPIELSLLQVEVLYWSVISEKIATTQELSNKVYVAFILQKPEIVHLSSVICDGIISTYDEGVIDSFEDLLFIFYVIHMLTFDYVWFLHALYRIFLLTMPIDPANANVSKSAYTLLNELKWY